MTDTMTAPQSIDIAEREFVISRLLDAPRDLVFNVWTQREHIERWFGPEGVSIVHCTNDLRPGGVMHYGMRTPDGNVMWGKWIYVEISAPERLVCVTSFSDEAGGVTRHPLSAGWPLETLSTITFEERNGSTELTIRWAPHNSTELERETFDAAHDGMRQGWTGTFNQLNDYLAKL